MKRMWILLVLGLVFGGAASAQQRPAAGDEAAVAKIRSDYEKAANAQDAAAIASLYAVDGVEMPPNGPAVKGRAAIEAHHKKLAATMTFANLRITSTEARVMGDAAYDVGTYTQQVTAKGGKPADDRGKYIVLLKKGPGGWAVSHAIYNSDLPPAPMPAAR